MDKLAKKTSNIGDKYGLIETMEREEPYEWLDILVREAGLELVDDVDITDEYRGWQRYREARHCPAQSTLIFKNNCIMGWNYLWMFLYCFVCEVRGQNNWYSNYNYIESLNEGVATVKKNNKCVVVDFKGKGTIPLRYNEIKRIDRKFFKARRNSQCGLFDKEGRLLIDVNYEDVGIFVNRLATVRRSGKYGTINESKNNVVPFQYDYIDKLSGGLIPFKKNYKYGYLNKGGKGTIPPIYDRAIPFKLRCTIVTINNCEFKIEKKG